MTDAAIATTDKPVWVDLATTDPAAARAFYAQVLGWQVEVNPDPQYGGYALAKVDGKDAAGIGGTQSPDQPAAWSVYVGSADVDALAQRVAGAGGTVIAPPFPVGDQGRMAVFQDPTGAFISAWQTTQMGGFQTQGTNAFGWAELNARGIDKASPFYEQIFGWTKADAIDMGPMGTYQLFATGSHPVGGMMNKPAEIPVPFWGYYFNVATLDAAIDRAASRGAKVLSGPMEVPGGLWIANCMDLQNAAFSMVAPSR